MSITLNFLLQLFAEGIRLPEDASQSFIQLFERIYEIVTEIPPGKVMTYGQIAQMIHDVRMKAVPAIIVGRAMAASGRYAPEIPWWRVIGREGKYGVLRKLQLTCLQKNKLAEEGITDDECGRYDLASYLYLAGG